MIRVGSQRCHVLHMKMGRGAATVGAFVPCGSTTRAVAARRPYRSAAIRSSSTLIARVRPSCAYGVAICQAPFSFPSPSTTPPTYQRHHTRQTLAG